MSFCIKPNILNFNAGIWGSTEYPCDTHNLIKLIMLNISLSPRTMNCKYNRIMYHKLKVNKFNRFAAQYDQ